MAGMNQFIVKPVANTEKAVGENRNRKRTEASIWKEVIEAMADPAAGMEEPERKNYEQKIMQKLKMGKRLSSEELDYLRIHNPDLYRTAMRVENARKAFRTRLSNCKSKEEAQQAISGQMEVLKAMKDDPDREYMTEMVKKEIETFKKSSAYAKLPATREEGEKKAKKKTPAENPWKEEMDKESFYKAAVYSRMQVQCEAISRLAQGLMG